MCNQAPDTSGMNAAAQQSAQLGQESFDWFKNYVDQTQGQRDQTTALDNQIAGQQVAGMTQANQQAADLYNRNKTVYQPLEDKIVDQAQNYDTTARRDAAANGAMSDVAQRLAVQKAANDRALQRTGIAPGSARSQSMDSDMALQGALGQQAAAAGARQQVENTGHAMEMDAAGLGKNVISNQATMLQTANQGGSAAVGASGAALGSATSAAPLMQTGFGQGMQGQQIAGNLYGQAGQLEQQSNNSMMSGIGGIASMAGMFMSSKKVKQNKKPVSGRDALAAVNKLPVEGWDYKPGQGDGGTHVGPYAEDVQKAMGDEVAPGGRMVNLASMSEINRKAIEQVTSQLKQVEAEIKRMEAA